MQNPAESNPQEKAAPAATVAEAVVASATPAGEEFTSETLAVSENGDVVLEEEIDEYGYELEKHPSLMGLVITVIAGILLGIAVFLGFQTLWLSVSGFMVAAIALAVVAGFVFGTHKLHTDKDKLSMIMAGLAGLVVTFGPALIVGVN